MEQASRCKGRQNKAAYEAFWVEDGYKTDSVSPL
jgi:hypothetical protein